MKRPVTRRMLHMLAAVTLLCGTAGAVPSGELLQQGLYAEEVEGDLPAAIEAYEKVIADPSAPSNHVAQSLYHEGMCYLTLKDEGKAAAALSKLVNHYSDQTNLVEKAKPVLANLQVFDPATLMPPGTLAYLELGCPGRQFETILEMLKGTPLEDPLRMISENNPDALSGEGALVAGLLNPMMQEEFKKIRSIALGVGEINQANPSVVGVLNLGDSTMLRGLLMTGLSMVARPGSAIEGMQTFAFGHGVVMACDDKVILAAYSTERLSWCIRQYKHLSSEPSLASGNPSFARLGKDARNQNVATLWVNADDLMTYVQQQGNPLQLQLPMGELDLANIDDLALTASLATDAIGLDGRIHFKDQNMVYEMIKTPSISDQGLLGVPADAVGLLSFDLADSGSMQAAQLRQLAMGAGVNVPAELFDCIEQVSLFALPQTGLPAPMEMPVRPGLIVSCKNPAPVAQFLESIKTMMGNGPELIVETAGNSVVVALDPQVVAKVKAALAGSNSVTEGGVLNAAAKKHADGAEKLVILNAGGLVGLAGIQIVHDSGADAEMAEKLTAAFGKLAEQFVPTTLTICTDEQPETLSLRAKVSGIPPASRLMAPINEVHGVIEEMDQRRAQAEAAAWAARLQKLLDMPPARVVATATAPVVDGEMDEAWSAAVAYSLTNTVFVNPGVDSEIAANYRMLWDAEKLYVLIDVTDSSPAYNPDLIWPYNDGVELYLDAADRKSSNYGDSEYQFGLVWAKDPASAQIVQAHGRQIEGMSTAMKNTEKGYCFEVSIPWKSLGSTVGPCAHIGMEVQVNDNRGRGGRDAKISWHDPYDHAWQNPLYFGTALLVGAAAE